MDCTCLVQKLRVTITIKKEFAYRLSDRQLDDIFERGNTVPHAGPALADARPNARPGRGAQCKT